MPVTAVRRLDAEARRSQSPCGDGSMVWRSWSDGPALVLLHAGRVRSLTLLGAGGLVPQSRVGPTQ